MPKIKSPKFSCPGERVAEKCPFCTFGEFLIGECHCGCVFRLVNVIVDVFYGSLEVQRPQNGDFDV